MLIVIIHCIYLRIYETCVCVWSKSLNMTCGRMSNPSIRGKWQTTKQLPLSTFQPDDEATKRRNDSVEDNRMGKYKSLRVSTVTWFHSYIPKFDLKNCTPEKSDISLYFPYKLSRTHHSRTSVNIIQRSQSCGSTPRLPRMSMSSTGPVAYPRGWPPGAPSQRQKAPWGSTWQKFGNPRPFRSGIQWWVTSWTCSCPPPFEILLFKVTFSKFLFKLSFQKSETTEKREKTQCTSYHPYNPFTPNPPAVISKRLNMTIHSNVIKCISTIFAFHFLESHFQLPTSPKKRAHMCSTTPSPKQPSTTLQQL